MGLLQGILFSFGIFLISFSEVTLAQTKRASRITSSRAIGVNSRTNSNGVDFNCPEEFGYYPHPSDCTQYYVCVFGGALLESCTGGLMYSHELQTCDWPRNVGCEVQDARSSPSTSYRDITQGRSLQQPQPQSPSHIRFSSTTSKPTIAQQYHRQPSQSIQIQNPVQTLPPPPELSRIAPNPVITSRGQPKPIIESQEDIAKLYADTHDTLPPIEEEESDRQQRVYRGQPSTLSQVQRDRDGIIHQPNANAIPNHGKVGSYAFGSAINQYRVETSSQGPQIFVQQQPQPQQQQHHHNPPQQQHHLRSKPLTEQNQNINNNNYNLNRNYYNTTTIQQQQQQYHQQQQQQQVPSSTPISLKSHSSQSLQSHPQIPFYSSYDDDDVDLYRDVEYNQQLQPQQPQQPQRGQSTYRPKEQLVTTPLPISVPQPPRDSFNKPILKPREPQYSNNNNNPPTQQQAHSPFSYSTDYEDSLAPQLDDENEYNEPTRQPIRINNNRNRGSATHFSSPVESDKSSSTGNNRGTHPPSRSRPTLKPASDIVSKTQQFVDIYRYPPTRPDPLYPQPTPDRTAAKCRKDVCLLPDCYCGGKDIPGDMPVESVPQIVLLTFDDSVNDLNKQLYTDLFEKGRVNPNGCPISATFYVSHEWTDYSQVQNLYSDGHEMASHTVSHSFGEQFSQKKWTKEVSGQREILSAYGGVKLSDIRGMRAPFLSIGGNKMFKMLYDSNFTYDSSMPVYENRPPSWPYTLDYKIFHDCMIPPCPTKSYPGVWEVPMVMWQDLNGGRCSMGDACSNPGDSDGVFKMIMKNFERHYTTNRAPFGLFYHAAWFTQPHHKAGFIKFLDAINSMNDVWIVTNSQALQWVRDPTPLSRINAFQPFQCDFSDRPKRCNNPKVCNLWHKSGVRYMRTCQPCPEIYPWTGKSGIRSSRVDNEVIEE